MPEKATYDALYAMLTLIVAMHPGNDDHFDYLKRVAVERLQALQPSNVAIMRPRSRS